MNHFTDEAGWHGIRSQVEWRFLADQPPGDHPPGAYFTTMGPDTPFLAMRLRIPRSKLGYRFEFQDANDLTPLRGGRGRWIYYSTTDYSVAVERQVGKGATGL